MKKDLDNEGMLPQTNECLEPPEPGKGKDGFNDRVFK